MDALRNYIRQEIKRISEEKYTLPPEIIDVLKNTLQLSPLIRYVKDAKAANTIPPSYRINLVNDTFFDIYYLGDQEGNFKIKIGAKEYDLLIPEELALSKDHINRLLTQPTFNNDGGGDEDEGGGEEGGGAEPDEDMMPEPEGEEEGEEEA
tara:strand:+ start:260 stop:712 length:453 start_codon:yes stop_codon:yes gene_type:complete